MFVSDSQCEVPLQDLLDHKTRRIIEFLDIETEERRDLILISKWRMGGTNINSYKQKKAEGEGIKNDCIFAISMTLLRLIRASDGHIYWQNLHPSSTSLCRPMELLNAKKLPALCREKEGKMIN